MGQKNAR